MVETQTKPNIFWAWSDAVDFQKRGDVTYWLPTSFSLANLSHRLSDFVELSDLRFDPINNPNGRFFYIDISNINTADGSYNKIETQNAYAPSRARKKLEQLDVIVSTVRPNRNATSIILEKNGSLVCSTGFAVLKAKKINPYYLFVFTKTPYFINQLVRQTSATMYPAVNEKDILNVAVFVPTTKDQQNIEQIIKEAFQLKKEAETDYQNSQQLLNETLGLTGVERKREKVFTRWSNEIDFVERLDVGYWQQPTIKVSGTKLSEVASVNTGKQYAVYENAKSEVEFISIKDFENLYVGEADRFVLKDDVIEKTRITRGDILLAVTGATIGKVGIFNRPRAVVSADVAIIRSKTLKPNFLGALIQSRYGKSLIDKYTYGATNKHLDIKGFSGNFIVPQIDKKIADKVSNLLDSSSKHREESRRKLQEAKDFVENLIKRNSE